MGISREYTTHFTNSQVLLGPWSSQHPEFFAITDPYKVYGAHSSLGELLVYGGYIIYTVLQTLEICRGCE